MIIDDVKALVTVAALLSTTLLASSCGGSSNAAPPTGAIAFAHCMRSSGVPNWPDPESSGVFDKSKLSSRQLGAGSARVQSAQDACRYLLPNGGRVPDAAQIQQVKEQGLQFARCVRAHGVPGFPDPGSDGRIADPSTVGINQGAPKFESANRACGRYRPPYMPSNAAYNDWARTHGQ